MNRTPAKKTLLRACEEGDIETVCSLLDAGADVNVKDPEGRTPLHHVCRFRGPLALAVLLVDHGADINARDVHDWTPLHYVCNRTPSNIEVILTLLSHGADVEARTANAQSTPIDFLCMSCGPTTRPVKPYSTGTGKINRRWWWRGTVQKTCPRGNPWMNTAR